MKTKRKAELALYSLFSIATLHKYYICEECHKVHKKTGDELGVGGGWYSRHVFVSSKCADKVVQDATKKLREEILNSCE